MAELLGVLSVISALLTLFLQILNILKNKYILFKDEIVEINNYLIIFIGIIGAVLISRENISWAIFVFAIDIILFVINVIYICIKLNKKQWKNLFFILKKISFNIIKIISCILALFILCYFFLYIITNVWCPINWKGNRVSCNIPGNIDTIKPSCFSSCYSGKNVILPKNIKFLEENAFENSYIEEIKIPENVEKIGFGCFLGSNHLKKVVICSKNYVGNQAFCNCTNLQSVDFQSNKITSIGNKAFLNCKNLKNVKLPNGILCLNDSLFENCEKLETLEIPKSVKIIKKEVFKNCKSLETVYIPENVLYLDESTFLGCKSLKKINVDKNNKNYSSENGILYDKSKRKLIYAPVNLNVDKNNIKILIKDEVKDISSFAFADWDDKIGIVFQNFRTDFLLDDFSLLKKTLDNNYVLIKYFNNTTDVLELSENIVAIKSYACLNCINLKKIIIKSSNITLGICSFEGCNNLSEIYVRRDILKEFKDMYLKSFINEKNYLSFRTRTKMLEKTKINPINK